MNKIVRDRYPVSLLPEDLRLGLPPGSMVRVTLEAEGQPPAKSMHEVLADVAAARKAGTWPLTTQDEAVARIRELRDEWDDERP
jgi:hypothetical protein